MLAICLIGGIIIGALAVIGFAIWFVRKLFSDPYKVK